MVKKMKDTVIAMPVDPKDDASKTELKIWDKRIESYVKRIDTYAEKKSRFTRYCGVSALTR